MDIDIENVSMCRAHPLDTLYVLNKIYTTLAASAYFNNESETGKKAITYYTGEGEEFLSTALADLPVRIIVMSDGKTLDMLVAESGIKNWLTSRTVARHDNDQKDSIDESAPFIVCGR